ncbi:hypothetical protein HIM_04682 [Hirsutella minnesotensis 3608]|uniref:Ribosomal RNA methyltransferase FtsJ domain-containing protein n=1 Tax=Hirsutella minnesotensis 3608 TaxID=1043627 RepID=A0A0F7ZV22_9HYPO|nr:hypothetical protein HIM_04682 [Hirsutella minnesotensis 3608]
MQQHSGVFRVRRTEPEAEPVQILDMCMAPGGFLLRALQENTNGRAVAFSLPPDSMGHEVLLPKKALGRVDLKYLDVTMLAEDMGMSGIPQNHAEAKAFLPRQIEENDKFDLVFCDGQVLRKHQQLEYREAREVHRLTNTQLAIGLEHMRPGGSMVVLLHKVEKWETVCLLRCFSQFARVKLYKPRAGHTKRSSFYMLAAKIQSHSAEAQAAVKRWKSVWRAATFGSQEEFEAVQKENDVSAEAMLDEFGDRLVELGRHIWRIQAPALARASFVK